jgi:type VI secretion system protein ImpA
MNDPSTFVPNPDALLAPIAPDAPGGASMRYHALYAGIRQAREEEDASLPMGVWERTLKKADWHAVEAQCIDVLTHHSKDLQVAAWLLEAWLQLYQVRGFNAGIALLNGLVEHYWDCVHPLIEDGDDDARAAPFVWINDNLSRALLLKLQLLKVPDCTPSVVTLAQWEQTLGQERQQGMDSSSEQLGEKPLTRERILAATQGQTLKGLLLIHAGLVQANAQWQALTSALDDRMTVNPPSISRVGEMLRRIERLAANLIDGRFPQPSQPDAPLPEADDRVGAPLQLLEAAVPDTTQALAAMPQGFTSREDAYRLLDVIASYLQELEPHSPTPYLVRRAVKWGRMPLGELMQEILREEGDVGRFFSLLGVDER